MKSTIKKSMMLGLGMTALTKDKIKKIVNDLKKKKEITAKEGKELTNFLIRESEKKQNELNKIIDQNVKKAVREAKKETKTELRKLEEKLVKRLKKK